MGFALLNTKDRYKKGYAEGDAAGYTRGYNEGYSAGYHNVVLLPAQYNQNGYSYGGNWTWDIGFVISKGTMVYEMAYSGQFYPNPLFRYSANNSSWTTISTAETEKKTISVTNCRYVNASGSNSGTFTIKVNCCIIY